MARHWEGGPVKTRLAAALGQEAARRVYRHMVERLWQGLEDSALERHLWVSPPQQLEACAAWLPGADRIEPQPHGDLGTRMTCAFEGSREHPWSAVIGTDCPALDSKAILAAGAALQHADVAISPTFDGGYALLALRHPRPELFEDIPWSTPAVLDTTLQRAASLGLEVFLGQTLRDLDKVEDLRLLPAEGLIDPDPDLD